MKLCFVPVLLLYPLLAILGAQPSVAGRLRLGLSRARGTGHARLAGAYRSGRTGNIHNKHGSVNVYTLRRARPPEYP